MNKKEAVKYIENIKNTYRPYHPVDNNIVPAWAYLVKDSMDDEECLRDGKRLFYFEIFTDEQIQYLYDNYQNSNPNYLRASCSFTAILSTIDNEKDISNIISSFQANSFKRITLVNDLSNISNNENYVSGRLEFSYQLKSKYRNSELLPELCDTFMLWKIKASLGITEAESLTRLKSVIEGIKNNRSIFTPPIEQLIPNENSSPSIPINVRIYNVGGANTAYVKYSETKSLLIDCGCDRFCPSYYTKTIKHIMDNVTPTAIIISHWHIDHNSLLDCIDISNLEFIIIPNRVDISPNALTAINDIANKKKVVIYDLSLRNTFNKNYMIALGYPKTSIFIGRGNFPTASQNLGTMTYTSTKNETSIMVSIGDQYKRIIFPSDVSYYNWPQEPELTLKDCIRFVVPHHGGSVYSQILTNRPTIRFAHIYVSSFFKPLRDIPKTHHRTYLNNIMNILAPPTYDYTKDKNTADKHCYFRCQI